MHQVNHQHLSRSKRSWWIPSAFGATLLIVVLSTTFVLRIKADDIWWHLATGRFILQTWTLPDLNIYSFTAPNHSWLPHEWLSEVVFYLVYITMGAKGLIAFGIALNAIGVALVYKITQRYSGSPFLSSLITLLAALMMLGNFSLRPYLFGNLFFIASIHAMEEPSAGGKLRPLLIFILFSAWANFHGSFIIGLALIMLYMAASITPHLKGKKRSWAPTKALLIDFSIAVVACTSTPHHIYGLIFPLEYIHNALTGKVTYLTNISEWQSAGFSTPLGRMIIFYVMFCMFAIAGSGISPAPIHIGLLVAFSFFSFSTIRNIPLLGIAATPVLARHLPRALYKFTRLFGRNLALADKIDRFHKNSVATEKRSAKLLFPILASLLLTVVFTVPDKNSISYVSTTGVRDLSDLSPGFYPKGLMKQLPILAKGRRVFNYFNWGGAIIWSLYPKIKVFIDQRNDCYPIDVFLDYFAVHEMKRGWKSVLDKWAIDAVAYPPSEDLTRILRDDIDWLVVWEDKQAVLLVRDKTEPWHPQSASPL